MKKILYLTIFYKWGGNLKGKLLQLFKIIMTFAKRTNL